MAGEGDLRSTHHQRDRACGSCWAGPRAEVKRIARGREAISKREPQLADMYVERGVGTCSRRWRGRHWKDFGCALVLCILCHSAPMVALVTGLQRRGLIGRWVRSSGGSIRARLNCCCGGSRRSGSFCDAAAAAAGIRGGHTHLRRHLQRRRRPLPATSAAATSSMASSASKVSDAERLAFGNASRCCRPTAEDC